MEALVVEFAGEEYQVKPGERFTFGRNGDLEIDSNPYLHRQLGVFAYEDHAWTLYNVGSAIPVELSDSSSTSRMTVAPGSSVALSFEESVLTFSAGLHTYSLNLEAPMSRAEFAVGEPPTGTQTISTGNMLLTPDQRLCLVGLAERRLRDRRAMGPDAIPTNREVAARLGWKITKFNRKLDNLCDKFTRAGVSGLRGDSSSLAVRRRERLVDHALTVAIVTESDLGLLDRCREHRDD